MNITSVLSDDAHCVKLTTLAFASFGYLVPSWFER